jgi:RES domain-containing protein
VYTSSSLALAALEYLVHVEPANVPADLIALTISVPDALGSSTVDAASLPTDWAQVIGAPECRAAGDAWLAAGETPLLRVPAAPIPEEFNILLNPRHPLAARCRIVAERPFAFDPRLLR